MAGTPMILAPVGRLAGPYAMLAMMPVLGGLAVLSFGGLTARLIGPRWAPVGALALALTWPMMMISRSIYSETAALVLMCGGLALTLDAVRADRRLPASARRAGARPDDPRAHRRAARRPAGRGVRRAAGGAAAAHRTGAVRRAGRRRRRGGARGLRDVPAVPPLRPRLTDPAALHRGGRGGGLRRWRRLFIRRRGLPDLTRFRLPDLAVPATFAVMAFFAARPAFQIVRRVPHNPDDRANAAYIGALQTVPAAAARPEPPVLRAEPALGRPGTSASRPPCSRTIGAGLLLRPSCCCAAVPTGLLPYAVIAWTTVTTLWRPGITPDHPWASRRLIVVVIPGLLLFALWTVAWAIRSVRRLGYGPQVAACVAVTGALLITVPGRADLGRAGVHPDRAGRGRPGAGDVPPDRAATPPSSSSSASPPTGSPSSSAACAACRPGAWPFTPGSSTAAGRGRHPDHQEDHRRRPPPGGPRARTPPTWRRTARPGAFSTCSPGGTRATSTSAPTGHLVTDDQRLDGGTRVHRVNTAYAWLRARPRPTILPGRD